MSIFLVETYILRVDMQDEYDQQLRRFVEYKQNHPKLFEGLLSWKLLQQQLGNPSGMYIEMWEYENLAAYEKYDGQIFADPGMKEISKEFHKLVEPSTFTASLWNPVA